jgi:hypothetical protein
MVHIPTEITFSGMRPSATLDEAIHSALDWLEPLAGRVASCHVTLTPGDAAHPGGSLAIACAISEGVLTCEQAVPALTPSSVARAARGAVRALMRAVPKTLRLARK